MSNHSFFAPSRSAFGALYQTSRSRQRAKSSRAAAVEPPLAPLCGRSLLASFPLFTHCLSNTAEKTNEGGWLCRQAQLVCRNNHKPMKSMKKTTIRPTVRGLVLALAGLALSSYVATATPYATCLTNNGDGSVSFRLNQTTTSNDSAWGDFRGGTLTDPLPTPGRTVVHRGFYSQGPNLFVIPPSTVFQIRIK